MRRLIFFVLSALPFFSIAQNKDVVSATRVFPKGDKVAAFEKALAAQKDPFSYFLNF